MSNEIDLTTLPSAALVEELARRDAVMKAEQERKERERRATLIPMLPALLTLVPDHDRTSCSDADPNNEYRECRRCILLYVKHAVDGWGEWPEEVTFEVMVHKPRRPHGGA
jgi:hypothetical protein